MQKIKEKKRQGITCVGMNAVEDCQSVDDLKGLLAMATEAVECHGKFQNSFFWRGGSFDSRKQDRDRYCRNHKKAIGFDYNGHHYSYQNWLNMSTNHVYYQGEFKVDGVKKDVRCFKKVIDDLERKIGCEIST